MANSPDVQRALDQAVTLMDTLDYSDLPEWVTYLLRRLDNDDRRDYDVVLEAVRDAIDVRLDEDRW